jgi:hypothetical protein
MAKALNGIKHELRLFASNAIGDANRILIASYLRLMQMYQPMCSNTIKIHERQRVCSTPFAGLINKPLFLS